MDNLRRTLCGYISKDDIPSSAILMTSQNYSELVGNVLYIPINLDYASITQSSMSYWPYVKVKPTELGSAYIDQIGMFIRKTNDYGYRFHASTDYPAQLYMPVVFSGTSFYYPYIKVRRGSTGGSLYLQGFSSESDSSYISKMDTRYFSIIETPLLYIKIKFSKDIFILEKSSNFSFDVYNIYIDTE